jgi:transcriptional regulator with PAS, ATPase and Fis domain
LEKAVKEGFRKTSFIDLMWFRLKFLVARTADDVVALRKGFGFGPELSSLIRGFHRRGATNLRQHHWPGNVRELSNIIERAAIFCQTNRGIECPLL